VRRLLAGTAVHALALALAAACLGPLCWMLSVSLFPPGEASAAGARLLPSAPTLDGYRALFERLALARAIANSALLATAITALGVFVNAAAGYAFAHLRFAGRDRVYRLLLASLVIPGQVGMLPLFLMLKQLGLVNGYGAVIVPGLASIFGIFLVRQYALSIPQSVLDAARVDGASELRIFVSIVLPLLRPILITLATFSFMGSWNDFLWPLVVLSDQDLHTLPVALANLLGEHVQDVELMMAGSLLTLLPVALLFLALQRHYVRGVLAGSVRG
jgi:multiple sugar transport system permease protein